MRKHFLWMLCFIPALAFGQQNWGAKFEQMGTMLPTPNQYRTGSGEPGPAYWQQKADYKIAVTLDDKNQKITGSETVTYTNNSPSTLKYIWVQLDQNVRKADNTGNLTNGFQRVNPNSNKMATNQAASMLGSGFDGGFKLQTVTDEKGNALDYLINDTMMKITLPTPLKTGDSFSFKTSWWYNVNDRAQLGGRSGYEYFKDDENYLYTIAQFYPRMAVYDDVNGWQNKQFLGSGEFALTFGDFEVSITVPSDHIVAATGTLQNPKDVLTDKEMDRLEKAKTSFDKPIIIVTEKEARAKEKKRANTTSTWTFKAENVRDFAFASSRKFIWDVQAVQLENNKPLAMSFYPKEGNPLWEKESTKAVVNTLKSYSAKSIDYPYPKAISVHAASIGMEYPMICFNFGRPNADGYYDDFTTTRMVSVIVHEVGHNFFPMIVNSDERQWAWMDEGINSFLEYLTMHEYYSHLPYTENSPAAIVNYMKGSKDFMRPIMTNPEQAMQLGPEAYSKPSAALVILREQVMGPELFDAAFKEYSQRWAFKHPKPADFFRTMEDASAVDLDWFWKGWFYTTDNVDIDVADVQWFKIKGENNEVNKNIQAQQGNLGGENAENPFYGTPKEIELTDSRVRGEYRSEIPNEEIKERLGGKNLYQITFKNNGGLVTPLLIEWTYKDGTKELEKVPAEIWRYNEGQVMHVFMKDKEVDSVTFDPNDALADVDPTNDMFPRKAVETGFDRARRRRGGN